PVVWCGRLPPPTPPAPPPITHCEFLISAIEPFEPLRRICQPHPISRDVAEACGKPRPVIPDFNAQRTVFTHGFDGDVDPSRVRIGRVFDRIFDQWLEDQSRRQRVVDARFYLNLDAYCVFES